MKNFKHLLIITLSLFTAQYSFGQSGPMKDPVSFKLKNGLTVIVAENLSTDKVYSSFAIDEAAAAGDNKPGMDLLLNAMLNESAIQSQAGIRFDEKGGNVAAVAADFDNSLLALSELIQEPVFTKSSFDKAKATLISSVNAKDKYYAESVTEDALAALTLNDIMTFYSKHTTPSKAYLTIAGDIKVDNAMALAKRLFGNWTENVLYAKSK